MENGTLLVAVYAQSINPILLMVWLASRERSDFADIELFSEAVLAVVSVLLCSPCLMRENKNLPNSVGGSYLDLLASTTCMFLIAFVFLFGVKTFQNK